MDGLRYIEGVATLELDRDRCTGCQACLSVCPHAVFELAEDRKVRITDLDACMECGACATNCAWSAISLTPGVGCAAAIIYGWLHGTEPSCDGPNGCCSGPAPEPAEPIGGCCPPRPEASDAAG